MELCPSISISSVENSLRKMVENGELIRGGSGFKYPCAVCSFGTPYGRLLLVVCNGQLTICLIRHIIKKNKDKRKCLRLSFMIRKTPPAAIELARKYKADYERRFGR